MWIELKETDTADSVQRNQVRLSFKPLFPNFLWARVRFCLSHARHSGCSDRWVTEEVTHSDCDRHAYKHTVDLLSSRTPHGGLQVCLRTIWLRHLWRLNCRKRAHSGKHTTHTPQIFWVTDRVVFTLFQEADDVWNKREEYVCVCVTTDRCFWGAFWPLPLIKPVYSEESEELMCKHTHTHSNTVNEQ